MDTSPEYAKMCFYPLIQDKAPDDWDSEDSREWWADIEAQHKTPDGLTVFYRIWTPRLDQWVDLLGLDSGAVFRPGTNESIVVLEAAWDTSHYAGVTIEQAACFAYMAQQGFKWTDSGWEVTE